MSSFINPRAEDHSNEDTPLSLESYKGYALNGKIMLTAIVVPFFVVILMVSLHLYARWYLLRARRRTRRTRVLFRHDNEIHADARDSNGGLDKAVLNSLPVFVYEKKSETAAAMECAVCLSEFEESETGRVLPKCNHTFHTECIDMWFHSHATCPLCRCAVEPPRPESDNVSNDVVLDVCEECNEEPGSGSGSRRKPMEIVVPRREGRSELESRSAFRSPMSRVLSLTRMLSRERRNGGVSPSGSNNNASCSSVAELDIERGRESAE